MPSQSVSSRIVQHAHERPPRPTEGDSQASGHQEGVHASSPSSNPTSENVNGEQRFNVEEDEASRLQKLSATVRNQTDLEKDIGRQADQMLTEQADERDEKRLGKTTAQKEKLKIQLRKLEIKLQHPENPLVARRIRNEIQELESQIAELDRDLAAIRKRIEERHHSRDEEQDRDKKTNQRMAGESRRDFLIRTGKITPFSKLGQSMQPSDNLADVMLDAEDDSDIEGEDEQERQDEYDAQPLSHRNLLKPGYDDVQTTESDTSVRTPDSRPYKRRKLSKSSGSSVAAYEEDVKSRDAFSENAYTPDRSAEDKRGSESSDSDFGVVFEATDVQLSRSKGKNRRKSVRNKETGDSSEDLAGIDDGNETLYQARFRKWIDGRKTARRKAEQKYQVTADQETNHTVDESVHEDGDESELPEWQMPHPTRPDTDFPGGLRIPGDIYPSLFDYQKTGVQWLWELYTQQVGGIIGDEMGLGKTIQVISFLAGLHHSGKYGRPTIVVTPATVMKQWVNEFHRWWPAFRVSILHTSGSGMLDVRSERQFDDELDSYGFSRSQSKFKTSSKAAKRVVDRVLNEGHILVTTYSGLQTYADLLIPIEWGYAVLDEGHKIRNPNTGITIYCKELRTPNRIILSGTPMQNNLTELWSLFDFVFPMRLGTLVNFRTQFEIPIKQGGYANASNLQVETAYNCAETLKDTISPYLLQRFKVDVAADLPKKSEQVLFCKLTKSQRQAYEIFLNSDEMSSIIAGKRQALYGIDILRKICNHPDLQDHKILSNKPGYNYGIGNKSGKMQVVKALLQLWKDTGHKTLLFAQHRIMLDILEKFVQSMEGIKYRRMDGNTAIKDRQDMVNTFNNDANIDVFLLTTKVGGLGVNLTGADRVIIYDPDWNPSTDVQARERAWRLGQKREVMIYRLMTAGTIEEKIYHRQIFKQFLTNKILRDPKQRQTFQLKDLHDLFVLGDADENETETGGLFKGTEVKFSSTSSRQEPNSTKTEDDSSKISSMPGISHREAFRTSDETSPPNTDSSRAGSPSTTTSPAQTAKDSRLLSTIFARSNVHSAHEHDAIINTSGTSTTRSNALTADPEIISREAKRVAAQAAKALQRAESQARALPAGTPTWTGTFGVAGRPDSETSLSARSSPAPIPRGGNISARGSRGGRGGSAPSSSSVLAHLSARQGTSNATTSSSTSEAQPEGEAFLKLIVNFFTLHSGRVPTRMLIDQFNRYCGTARRTAEFKEMLREVAVLEKRGVVDAGAESAGAGAARGRANWARGSAGLRSRIEARAQRRADAAAGIGQGEGSGAGGRGIWLLRREFGGTA